ncbi:MAG: GAF domain-containing protein [Anaerolineae bacterium]|jgi:GAF domain-containing protein
MPTWIRRILTPPVFEGDPDKTRTARLLNVILWAYQAIWVLGILAMPIAENPLTIIPVLVSMFLLGFAVLALMRSGRVRLAGGLFSFLLGVLATGLLVVSDGLSTPMILGYAAVVLVAALLLGSRAAVTFAGLSVVAAAGITAAKMGGFLPRVLISDQAIPAFATYVGNIVAVAALLYITISSLNEALGQARRYAGELEGQRQYLEETVEARTQDLTRRTRYLEATAVVARETASVLELQELLVRVVNLVTEQFGFYHSGIFLLDPGGEWAVLQAASSEGGQRMLARHHRLRMGTGMVGYVARRGEPRIALDVGEDAVFFNNPDLPETRSEIALPLRARGEVIGALDVQSMEPAAFRDEDAAVLQTLADQVAVAIDNARLLQQAQESLAAERRAYGELSREAWRGLLQTESDLGFLSRAEDTVPAGELWRPEMEQALQTARTTLDDEGGTRLAVPIQVGDHVIGVVDGRKAEGSGRWTEEEVELLEAMAAQLNVALEGARLYRDTQRRAAQEQLVGQVTARMRESLEVERVLRTASEEIYQALGLEELEISLNPASGTATESGEDSA